LPLFYCECCLLIQAGAFGEHRFESVTFNRRISDYPGKIGSYGAPTLQTKQSVLEVAGKLLRVEMPPATEIVLELQMTRFVNQPTYALPW
jgi:hypothetical protein